MFIRKLLIFILATSVLLAGCASSGGHRKLSDMVKDGMIVSNPLSVSEIEQKSLEKMHQSPSAPQVPFGYANARWERLKSLIQPGDFIVQIELTMRPNGEYYSQEGFALVRGDLIIDVLIIKES